MAETPYIATQDIAIAPGVFAHRVGEVVPAENVKANGWESLVARAGTKAADKAVDAAQS